METVNKVATSNATEIMKTVVLVLNFKRRMNYGKE